MRYHRTPNFFRTRHWAKLWQNNIPDLESLQICMGKTGFVAIDAEPWGDQSALVAEIALSLVYPFDRSNFDQCPNTTSQLRSGLRISTHCVKISGREQGRRERSHADDSQTVPLDEVEPTLVNILDSFKTTLAAQRELSSGDRDHPAQLVLIGFDLGFEFRSISTSYPLITEYFTSWVDLQELVKDISQADRAPTMRDSLIALGFGDDRHAIGSIHKKHSSGMDTLRMTALLVGLLFYQNDAPLNIQFTNRRKWSPGKAHGRYMGTGKFFHKTRPKPKEFHPFTAEVLLRGSSLNEISASRLYDMFAHYDPLAAGNGSNKRRNDLMGWVSLPSLEALDYFVKDINGAESEYGGMWQAVSLYDPILTPIRTASELESFKELRLQEEIQEKRSQRTQKKLSMELKMNHITNSPAVCVTT
ncbi:hypothetical protein QQS21_000702 [Conoideocrella luteorostrata]|uniref:Uncharacterized protein n=1 Tax=Conoideocrella luteorostrata TaxID=1105319 RepID=A0AAJ0FZ31_9HYPO|nr:hypothetical protein QQS21_000702 [Conoideocrella luteorostrata]